MKAQPGWRLVAQSNPARSNEPSRRVLIDVGGGKSRILDRRANVLLAPRPLEVEQVKGAWYQADQRLADLDQLLDGVVDVATVKRTDRKRRPMRWSLGAPWTRSEVPPEGNGCLSARALMDEYVAWRSSDGMPFLEVAAAGDLKPVTDLMEGLFNGARPDLRGLATLVVGSADDADEDTARLVEVAPGFDVVVRHRLDDREPTDFTPADLVVFAGAVSDEVAPTDRWRGRCATIILDSSTQPAVAIAKELADTKGSALFVACHDGDEQEWILHLVPSVETKLDDRVGLLRRVFRDAVANVDFERGADSERATGRLARVDADAAARFIACFALAMGLEYAKNVEPALQDPVDSSIPCDTAAGLSKLKTKVRDVMGQAAA